jgi:hypothetical protein
MQGRRADGGDGGGGGREEDRRVEILSLLVKLEN